MIGVLFPPIDQAAKGFGHQSAVVLPVEQQPFVKGSAVRQGKAVEEISAIEGNGLVEPGESGVGRLAGRRRAPKELRRSSGIALDVEPDRLGGHEQVGWR